MPRDAGGNLRKITDLFGTRTTIVAVAIAAISFLFIQEYQPLAGVFTNMMIGEICVTSKQPVPQPNTGNILDQLLHEQQTQQAGKGGVFDQSVAECDLAIPYKWILAFAIGLVTINLMVRFRR